jgi:hypothetical protein
MSQGDEQEQDTHAEHHLEPQAMNSRLRFGGELPPALRQYPPSSPGSGSRFSSINSAEDGPVPTNQIATSANAATNSRDPWTRYDVDAVM